MQSDGIIAYAHSLSGRDRSTWEKLGEHLDVVGRRAAAFADAFGFGPLGLAAGRLHDIGKVSQAFQAYIAAAPESGGRGPDHSTAGAREAIRLYPGPPGRMLAISVAGHHAGLADADELDRRLAGTHRIEPYAGWQAHAGSLPGAADLLPEAALRGSPSAGFSECFLIRMLFSCLVDADRLETAAFHARAAGEMPHRIGHAVTPELRGRLRAYMAALPRRADPKVDALRDEVLAHATDKAALDPGLFTLTVPTGGGKTLASLSFALEHAIRHGLRRVVHVIPFTSVIEQTAAVFRDALGDEAVLEHHSGFDRDAEEEDGPDGLAKLRRATENWDVPVVVTTAVQFFESLFASQPSRCRKLHNLARSVVVLDEAQTIPLHVLRPCMEALRELAANYRASVVLCTATQPALRTQQGFHDGLDIPCGRELAPEPKRLYAALKRVGVERLAGPVEDAVVAARFAEQPQMLCIVNSRAHARALHEAIAALPGAVHLSTLMVPKHRRAVLAEARRRIAAGEPARIVSTSLIEAGVDIDLPEVWRAAAGLDSIAQAAGRCNRNGRLAQGRVVVFEPAVQKPPKALKEFWDAARPVFRAHEDLLGPDAVRAYFQSLYWQKGGGRDATAFDSIEVGSQRRGVLPALQERARDLSFPFQNLGKAFRLIEDEMQPVVVPWDEPAVTLLEELAAMERPAVSHLRKLQSYVVSIPRRARAEWLARGALRAVHPGLAEGLLAFDGCAHYRAATGLDLEEVGMRAAESNIF